MDMTARAATIFISDSGKRLQTSYLKSVEIPSYRSVHTGPSIEGAQYHLPCGCWWENSAGVLHSPSLYTTCPTVPANELPQSDLRNHIFKPDFLHDWCRWVNRDYSWMHRKKEGHCHLEYWYGSVNLPWDRQIGTVTNAKTKVPCLPLISDLYLTRGFNSSSPESSITTWILILD